MENLINEFLSNNQIISNSMINEIACNSECKKNLLGIEIPFKYALNLVKLNWNDILFAISNDYFKYTCAIDYSITQLNNEVVDNDILNLACTSPDEIIKEEVIEKFVLKFASLVSTEEKNKTESKVLYLLLSWLFEKKHLFQDVSLVLAIIYDDFGRPKSISNLINYLPDEEVYKVNFYNYQEKLYYNWNNYIKSQKDNFK